MANSKSKIVSTYLVCKKCSNKVSIFRLSSKQKQQNHIKTLYCYKCKERTKHKESKYDYA